MNEVPPNLLEVLKKEKSYDWCFEKQRIVI